MNNYNNNKGEIATLMTFVAIGVMLAGIFFGVRIGSNQRSQIIQSNAQIGTIRPTLPQGREYATDYETRGTWHVCYNPRYNGDKNVPDPYCNAHAFPYELVVNENANQLTIMESDTDKILRGLPYPTPLPHNYSIEVNPLTINNVTTSQRNIAFSGSFCLRSNVAQDLNLETAEIWLSPLYVREYNAGNRNSVNPGDTGRIKAYLNTRSGGSVASYIVAASNRNNSGQDAAIYPRRTSNPRSLCYFRSQDVERMNNEIKNNTIKYGYQKKYYRNIDNPLRFNGLVSKHELMKQVLYAVALGEYDFTPLLNDKCPIYLHLKDSESSTDNDQQDNPTGSGGAQALNFATLDLKRIFKGDTDIFESNDEEIKKYSGKTYEQLAFDIVCNPAQITPTDITPTGGTVTPTDITPTGGTVTPTDITPTGGTVTPTGSDTPTPTYTKTPTPTGSDTPTPTYTKTPTPTGSDTPTPTYTKTPTPTGSDTPTPTYTKTPTPTGSDTPTPTYTKTPTPTGSDTPTPTGGTLTPTPTGEQCIFDPTTFVYEKQTPTSKPVKITNLNTLKDIWGTLNDKTQQAVATRGWNEDIFFKAWNQNKGFDATGDYHPCGSAVACIANQPFCCGYPYSNGGTDAENYNVTQGEYATVKLFYDDINYKIVQQCFNDDETDPTKDTLSTNCVDTGDRNFQNNKLLVKCGQKYRYGWVLERIEQQLCKINIRSFVKVCKDAACTDSLAQPLTIFDKNTEYGTANDDQRIKNGDNPWPFSPWGHSMINGVGTDTSPSGIKDWVIDNWVSAPSDYYQSGRSQQAIVHGYFDADRYEIVKATCAVRAGGRVDGCDGNASYIKLASSLSPYTQARSGGTNRLVVPMNGLLVDCNSDYEYGWYLKEKDNACYFKPITYVKLQDAAGNENVLTDFKSIGSDTSKWGSINEKRAAIGGSWSEFINGEHDPCISNPRGCDMTGRTHCCVNATDDPAISYEIHKDKACVTLKYDANVVDIVKKCDHLGVCTPITTQPISTANPASPDRNHAAVICDLPITCTSYRYGWVVKLKSQPPSPIPTDEPDNKEKRAHQLDVDAFDPNNPTQHVGLGSCFVAGSDDQDIAKIGGGSHCLNQTARLKNTSRPDQYLRVDYKNTTGSSLYMRWQINSCERLDSNNDCKDYVASNGDLIELPRNQIISCTWNNPKENPNINCEIKANFASESIVTGVINFKDFNTRNSILLNRVIGFTLYGNTYNGNRLNKELSTILINKPLPEYYAFSIPIKSDENMLISVGVGNDFNSSSTNNLGLDIRGAVLNCPGNTVASNILTCKDITQTNSVNKTISFNVGSLIEDGSDIIYTKLDPNEDGVINALDSAVCIVEWGLTVKGEKSGLKTDVNNDGVVNAIDCSSIQARL